MLLLFDGAVAFLSLWTAMLLRFEGTVPEVWLAAIPPLAMLLILARVVSTYLFRVHRWSFRFSGLTDGARVVTSCLFGTGLFMLGVYLLRPTGPPRSVVALELLLTTAIVAGIRFTPRLAWLYQADRTRARREDVQRTLIVGAGAAGEMLLRDLRRSQEHSYRVLGFVDDDAAKRGTIVGGVPVFGAVSDLPEVVRTHSVGKLLIAIPRLPAEKVREILSLCADLKVRFKILPVSFIYFQDRQASSMLQDLSPEDLLPRDTVKFSPSEEAFLVAGRCALVTGGAGSIGSEICCQLLERGISKLIIVDLNENGLYFMKRRLEREYPQSKIFAEVGDVRDASRIETLFRQHRPQDVFHAAAHKHVPLMERAPCEAVKNNVMGTRNVALATDRFAAERFVFISTDKAVRPSSIMGATKRVGEMLVRDLARRSKTRFSAVRFGNVLNSAGSVVPLFREQIAAGGPVTVTHPEVRRYFMTISEAVGLVLRAAYGNYGELCILEMGSQIRILDLARHMITMSGKTPELEIGIEFTGLRPGEKLFEELLTDEEGKTRKIDEKILVAESSPPPVDLADRLLWMIKAAQEEDRESTLATLESLVPSYAKNLSEQAEKAYRTSASSPSSSS
ncbi:MAG: polysaccharide biosynthesis protein [Deltaproteobacteria bacterium]|nr:polysaccharide biosynthesis protein [Deltaproteobacteria bacterium]